MVRPTDDINLYWCAKHLKWGSPDCCECMLSDLDKEWQLKMDDMKLEYEFKIEHLENTIYDYEQELKKV